MVYSLDISKTHICFFGQSKWDGLKIYIKKKKVNSDRVSILRSYVRSYDPTYDPTSDAILPRSYTILTGVHVRSYDLTCKLASLTALVTSTTQRFNYLLQVKSLT